jgi:hypothetical protein
MSLAFFITRGLSERKFNNQSDLTAKAGRKIAFSLSPKTSSLIS